MTKPPTLYTFEKFKVDQQGDNGEAAQAAEPIAPQSLANEDQLRLFLHAIQFLADRCGLYKSALMREIGVPNEQLHQHFAIGKSVPVAELEEAAEALGITLGELLTVSDWYSRRTKYRTKMLKHLAREKLIPRKRASKEKEE